jgi:Sec-independent protein translocase protein TatA
MQSFLFASCFISHSLVLPYAPSLSLIILPVSLLTCQIYCLLLLLTYQFTILLVGYFVLGPSDLYKIVKEVGKFVQNFRTLSTDLTTSFENNMESTLQLEELRKAQQELTDAFSFRRSINVDDQANPFTTPNNLAEDVAEAVPVAAAAAAATATGETVKEPVKKLKIRRRVKKKPTPEPVPVDGSVPDLEMPLVPTAPPITSVADKSMEISDEEAALIDAEFDKYSSDVVPPTVPKDDDWYGVNSQTRFQQQMTGGWNESVMANEDSLGLMAVVMNKIALLEKEKISATERLEEEFQKRQELEDKYYQAQRKLLEEASQEVQVAAMGLKDSTVAAPADSK